MEIKRKIKIEFDLDFDVPESDWNEADDEQKEIYIKEKVQEFLIKHFDSDYAKVEIIDPSNYCEHLHQKWITDSSGEINITHRICVDCTKIMTGMNI